MRKVTVIYDDSIRPGQDIRTITGGKSFGNTIFKRITLADHTEKNIEGISEICECIRVENAKDTPGAVINGSVVLKLYSCFIISDMEEFRILVKKAVYAHDNYKVSVNNKIACVIYKDAISYTDSAAEDDSDYTEIQCSAFTDISDVNNFRQFITSGFEARFFNAVSGDDYTVVKKSTNVDKLKSEYMFYGFLPESMKSWFVMPYDFKVSEDGKVASYTMERYHMADLAIRYVHGAIPVDEFETILDKLFVFIGSRIQKSVTPEKYGEVASKLYLEKVDDRIAALKECEAFDSIEKMLKDGTSFDGIDEVVAAYRSVYESIVKDKTFKSILVAGHGDLCFSNILYSPDTSLMRFIDPKGALCEEDIYSNPYYDIAKLSHSICGGYDLFNSDLYQVVVNDNLKTVLSMDFDNTEYINLFKKKLQENSIDIRLIRLYECSLFLSMLPLHIDRPKKVFGFILNAIGIIEELRQK